MSSKRWWMIAVCAVSIAISGCGMFGRKADLKKFLEMTQGSSGCLNKANEKIEAFLQGTVNPSEWNALWNCAIDTIDMFNTFVRGSSEQGFTQEDIQAMVSMVLVTDKPISNELIDAHFAIKASILGGSRHYLAGAEIQRLVRFLRFAQQATTRLIAPIGRLRKVPLADDLLQFADAVAYEADGLARVFRELGVENLVPFERTTAVLWLSEIKKLYGWEFSTDFLNVVFAGKKLMASGATDLIEGQNLPTLADALGRFGGLALAYVFVDQRVMTGPNAYGEFMVNLVQRLRNLLQVSIRAQNGVIPFEAFDELIDTLPAHWLTIDRTILKNVLRPTVQRLLESGVTTGLDEVAVENAVRLADQWRKGKTLIDTLFANYNLNVSGATPESLVQAAEQHKSQVSQEDVAQLDRIIGLIQNFKPLYLGDDRQISFTGNLDHRRNSRHNLTQFHFSNFLVSHILRVYSTDFANRPNKGSKDEFLAFWTDFKPMMGQLKILDPTVINSGDRRFTEADVFLLNSNGDGYMSVDEGTYYLPYLSSIGVLTDRIEFAILAECKRPELGKDFYGYDWMDMDCFRASYYRQYRSLWDFFPELVSEYSNLNPSDLDRLKRDTEVGARRYGISNCPIGMYDAQGYAGIAYFIESMFARFDRNKSGRLGTDDVLAAYPIFRRKIAEIAGMDPVKDDAWVKAIFTYIMNYGVPPKSGFWGSVDLVRWKLLKPFWSIKAHRKDVYKIVSLFSTTEVSPNCGMAPMP